MVVRIGYKNADHLRAFVLYKGAYSNALYLDFPISETYLSGPFLMVKKGNSHTYFEMDEEFLCVIDTLIGSGMPFSLGAIAVLIDDQVNYLCQFSELAIIISALQNQEDSCS